MKNLFIVFLVVLLIPATGQNTKQWGNLEAGPYAVGFTVVETYDRSRQYQPRTDYLGNPNSQPLYKPFQVSVWYPAKSSTPTMAFEEYLKWWASERDFNKKASAQEITDLVKYYFGYFFPNGMSDEQVNRILKAPTPVVRNGTWAAGTFPLVINACPSLHTHTVMNEFLASHGYVVMSFPALGQSFSAGAIYWSDASDLDSFTEDIGFTFSQAFSFKNVAPDKLAIIGTGAGASGMLWTMKNMNVDAIVSVDGEYSDLLKSSPYYNPARFSAPLLHFANKRYDPFTGNTVMNELRFSDITSIQLQLEHPDLYGQRMMSFSAQAEHQRGYELMCKGTLAFLHQHVKNLADATTLTSLFPGNDPLYAVVRQAAIPPPATVDLIAQLFTAERYDLLVQKLQEGVKNNTVQAVWSSVLDRQGNALLRAKKYTDALIVLKQSADTFPADANIHFSLSKVYQETGDMENLKKTYQHLVTVLGSRTNLSNREKFILTTAQKGLGQ